MQTPMMRKKMKVIMMMKVSTTRMVEGPILDLMMGVQEKVLQDEDDEVPVLIHLMEKIQMEVTTLSIPMSRYHVGKLTKSWFPLSPR